MNEPVKRPRTVPHPGLIATLAGPIPQGYPSWVVELSEIAPETPRLLTRAEYERLIDTGLFEDERVELLEGVIIRMSPHGPEHDSVIEYLTELLVRQLAQRACVRVQSGYAASDSSQSEPDLAVVPEGDYGAAHPRAPNTLKRRVSMCSVL